MGFASAGAGVAKGAAISARTVARLNAKVTMKPVASATSTPRLATAQAPVLPPCWARIHDCGDDLRHHAAVWGLSCGDVGARTSEIQRLGKALESAGIKLGSVASELTGKSATAMIEALIDGERRGRVLAGLVIGRMRTAGKLSDLSRALAGRFTDHHALLCRRQRRDAGQHRGRADPAQRLPGRHPRMACLSPAVLREVRPRVARTAAGRRQRQRHRLARRIPGHCGTRSRLAEDPGGGEARGVHRGRRPAGGPRLAGERLRPFTGDGRLRPSLRALRRCQLQPGFVLPRRVPPG